MTPEALLAPVDAVRSALLRPWGTALRPLLLSRERRVAWVGAFGITLALAVTCAAPLWALALGPVLLGVPHVLADLRYLVVRPRLHRRWPLVLLAGAPLAIAAVDPRVEVGLFAALGAVLAARASLLRKAVLLGTTVGSGTPSSVLASVTTSDGAMSATNTANACGLVRNANSSSACCIAVQLWKRSSGRWAIARSTICCSATGASR